jgi:hypothetical protein
LDLTAQIIQTIAAGWLGYHWGMKPPGGLLRGSSGKQSWTLRPSITGGDGAPRCEVTGVWEILSAAAIDRSRANLYAAGVGLQKYSASSREPQSSASKLPGNRAPACEVIAPISMKGLFVVGSRITVGDSVRNAFSRGVRTAKGVVGSQECAQARTTAPEFQPFRRRPWGGRPYHNKGRACRNGRVSPAEAAYSDSETRPGRPYRALRLHGPVVTKPCGWRAQNQHGWAWALDDPRHRGHQSFCRVERHPRLAA